MRGGGLMARNNFRKLQKRVSIKSFFIYPKNMRVMETLETRKLQLIGGSSYMITLPKEWVLLNKLKQGEEIVLQIQNESIVVYPKKRGREIIGTTIKLTKTDKNFLAKFMYALYMLGLDEIVLECDEIPPTLVDDLSDIVHSLIGMEIIDLSENRIVLQCLTTHDLDITNVLKRKVQIASRIFNKIEACIKTGDTAEISNISRLEKDTDRLYFLAVRLENRMMKEMQIPSNWDALRFILGSRMVAKFIEEIVDLLHDFSRLIEYISDDKKQLIADYVSKLHTLFRKSFDAYLCWSDSPDLDGAERTVKMIEDFYHKIRENVKSDDDPHLKLPLQMLLIICRQIKAIGEIAFNRAVREISRKNLRLLSKPSL